MNKILDKAGKANKSMEAMDILSYPIHYIIVGQWQKKSWFLSALVAYFKEIEIFSVF